MRLALAARRGALVRARRERPGRGRAAAAVAAPAGAGSRKMPLEVTFVTGNANKLKEVRAILGEEHAERFVVSSAKVDLPELQGEPHDIAREKARLAAQQLGGAVFTEDTSLCFNALGGLPGPYIKWFLEKLGHDGLNKLLAGFDDKTAYAQCVFGYCAGPGEEPVVFDGRTPGRIVPARGPPDFGWDPIFEADGHGLTYAEMDKELKNSISHRYRALDKLREHLLKLTA